MNTKTKETKEVKATKEVKEITIEDTAQMLYMEIYDVLNNRKSQIKDLTQEEILSHEEVQLIDEIQIGIRNLIRLKSHLKLDGKGEGVKMKKLYRIGDKNPYQVHLSKNRKSGKRK